MSKIIQQLLVLVFLYSVANGATPILNFTDITSGPSTGNGDGLGSGVIVTVWGNNLGSSQGTSTITVNGTPVTQVYYWQDADGSLPGGPADLDTYHKMQEVCFAVPATATTGDIVITVNGVASNGLPFTVRSGNIYFISSGGNDSTGDGSWSSPWATLQGVMSNPNSRLTDGDTIYSIGVGSTVGMSIGSSGRIVGTEARPVSLIAYPNTSVPVSGSTQAMYVVYNYNTDNDDLAQEYVNFSKISVTCARSSATGFRGIKGMRIVGVEITGPTVYEGYQGAIGGNQQAAGGGKFFGVYIHHYGTDNGVPYAGNTGTSPPYNSDADRTSWDIFHHLYYLSNRYSPTNLPYEIGWNHLTDNPVWQGIHIYDYPDTGGWSGPLRVHHNVVKNQRGGAIEVDLSTMTVYPEIEIYNNLVISDADDVYTDRALQIRATYCNVKLWNNTIYGQNRASVMANLTEDYRNNIFYDHKGVAFFSDTPSSHSNNLFYSSEGVSQPSWAVGETGNVTGDPLFSNATGGDFSLQDGSPAIGTGYNTISIVDSDLTGMQRVLPISIGAFEAVEAATLQAIGHFNQSGAAYFNGTGVVNFTQ